MKNRKTKIKARVSPVNEVMLKDQYKMYKIFETYYDGVSWDEFQSDFREKNDVILLESSEDGICGFSTLLTKEIKIDGKKVIGVFSGDTILAKKHWGSPALGIRFLAYLWMLKLRNPGTPVYWFLISKGYKTYLLMANNFTESYPDFRHPVPEFAKKLMDHFYHSKFGDQYQRESGVIHFAKSATCKLRNEIAPITDELRRTVPRIAYFEKANPGWEKGDELACIARMTLTMPVRYFIKKKILAIFKRREKAKAHLPLGYDRRISPVRLGPTHRKGIYG